MVTSSTSDLYTHKSLKISITHPNKDHHHNKLFSNKRLITRSEILSMSNNFSSFEDYHGESSVSVPFMWESQPGTPKVKYFRENPDLPPLTPPPSYCYSPDTKISSPAQKSTLKAKFLQKYIFPKQRKRFPSSSPSLSPSSSSSLLSSPRLYSSVPSSPAVSKTPSLKSRGRRRNVISSPRLSVDSRVGDHEDEEYGSPVSTLCFGRGGPNARSRSGCYSSLIKVLLS